MEHQKGVGFIAHLPPLDIQYEEYYESSKRSNEKEWRPWQIDEAQAGVIEGIFISSDSKVSRFFGNTVRPPCKYDPVDCGLGHGLFASEESGLSCQGACSQAHMTGFPIFYSIKMHRDDTTKMEEIRECEFIVEQVTLSSHQRHESTLTETGDALRLRSWPFGDRMNFDTEAIYAYEEAQRFLETHFPNSKLRHSLDTLVLIGQMEIGN